jgi:hypothetical protein
MYWAQQIAAAPVLAAFILLLSLLPARHVLMPFWPARVDEWILLETDPQSAVRYLSSASAEVNSPDGLVARTRPFSVAWVEHRDGRHTLGYPVGLEFVAEQGGETREALPPEFSRELLETVPERAGSLVLLDANDREFSVPLSDLRRLYYPNRMTLAGRVRVLVSRVSGCWMQLCPLQFETGHQTVTGIP